jgi:hypothetical protein
VAVPPPRPSLTVPLVGGVVGAAFCLLVFGAVMVRPTNLGWTMRHDTQTYVLAFHHFRREPWQWPPGKVVGVGHPVGTSVGNSDAIPLLAFPLKPLHWWLPDPLQYLGAWVLVCYALQGVFAVLLMRQATADATLQLLGAALFVQVPALLDRFGHTALNAHWTLLAAIWIAADREHDRRWRLVAWLLLSAAVAAIQPYLAVMVVGLAVAALANDAWAARSRGGALPRLAVAATAVAAVTGVVFWMSGYFLVGSASDLGSGGFGRYSMNLLSAVSSQGYSRLLPPIAVATDGQYEGLIYFGAGWLAVAAVGVVLLARRRAAWPPLGLGWLVVLGFLLLAISPVITVGSTVIADLLPWTPSRLGVFRSSGRFAWLAMYVAFTAALGAVVTALPRRAAVGLAAAAVLLQAVDLSGAYRRIHDRAVDPAWTEWTTPLQSPVWPAAAVRYRHLVTVAPDMCAGWTAAGPHLPFSLLAGRAGATMNSGFAGRYDLGAVQRYCRALKEAIADGRVDDDSLYVLSPAERQALAAVTRTPLACGVADGFDVCVTAATYPLWREAAAAAGLVMAEVPAAR